MARTVPIHWFRGGSRPLELEPPETIAPTLALATVGPPRADGPEPFGRKCAWLAVRSEDHAHVLRALGVTGSTRCGWAEGLATAYREDQVVFLTPPIQGWTLVLAPLARFYDASDGLHAHLRWLCALSGELGEVQAFESQRVSTHFSWSRARDGKVLRSCRYSEYPIWSVGAPGAEEGPADSEPDEETVLAIARAWSVDPEALAPDPTVSSTGTLGLLPPTAVRVYEPTEYQRGYPEQAPEPAAKALHCRVYWNPAALKLGYELEPIAVGEGGRLLAGRRRRLRESVEVPRLVEALRVTLGKSADSDAGGESVDRRRRSSLPLGDPPRTHGGEVVVEVEQRDGVLRFWPTRRRFGRVRREESGRIECAWAARAGVVAWSLDEAIVRAMRLRPLWRILVEIGQG